MGIIDLFNDVDSEGGDNKNIEVLNIPNIDKAQEPKIKEQKWFGEDTPRFLKNR